MVKIDPPGDVDIDELKKRGGTSRHIVKRVADSVTRDSLDSPTEERILNKWIRQTKSDDIDICFAGDGNYASVSRLDEYIVVMKEVELEDYRPDSIIRWPDGQSDGRWTIVEVKKGGELSPDVVGHLLMKSAMFRDLFTVRSNQVEEVLLADSIPTGFNYKIKQLNDKHDIDIRTEEVRIE
jgi:hypothetical protein